jgi:hypothetical protein
VLHESACTNRGGRGFGGGGADAGGLRAILVGAIHAAAAGKEAVGLNVAQEIVKLERARVARCCRALVLAHARQVIVASPGKQASKKKKKKKKGGGGGGGGTGFG